MEWPFFVNCKRVKVNQKTYCCHLDKELFPTIEKVVKRSDWIFSQDGAPSHRANTVQDYLTRKLKRRFIRAEEWPPSSPDLNPLDYFYWDLVRKKCMKKNLETLLNLKMHWKKELIRCGKNALQTLWPFAKQSSNLSLDWKLLKKNMGDV